MASLELNVAVVGESGAGKSTLVNRFVNGNYEAQPKTTFLNNLSVTKDVYGKDVKFSFYDSPGAPEYRDLALGIYAGADAVILCFDICDQQSFNEVEGWMEEIKQRKAKKSILILVGLKTDKSDRVIQADAAQKLAKKNDYLYLEASSLSGTGAAEVFITAASKFHKIDPPPKPGEEKKEHGLLVLFHLRRFNATREIFINGYFLLDSIY
uniref:Ras-related protein SEC4 n=1 Tax=Schistocephalus solidus TaxID=70667 RepID=A0A0X3Q600_SCHSO